MKITFTKLNEYNENLQGKHYFLWSTDEIADDYEELTHIWLD